MSETAAGRKAHTRALGHKQARAARMRAAAYRRHAVAADADFRAGIARQDRVAPAKAFEALRPRLDTLPSGHLR